MNPIFPLEQWHEARVSRDVAQLSSQPAPLLLILFRSYISLQGREEKKEKERRGLFRRVFATKRKVKRIISKRMERRKISLTNSQ